MRMSNIVQQGFAPTTLTEAMQFSEMLSKSQMVPRQYQGKPEDVLVAMQWGREIGLAPLQALQNISVINGKPSVYGDAAMALVQASPVCEGIEETIEGEGTANPTAICVAKRKGRSPVVAKFSVEDAKRAGLWGKQGPWQAYPKRMLQMRARGFALRDAFPDVLKGLITAEEAQDFPDEARPTKDITPPKPRNPLDAIAMSEISQDIEQNDPQREYAEVEEVNQQLQEEAASRTDEVLTPVAEASLVQQITKQFEDAGIEIVEVVDTTWSLGVPGNPDRPCQNYQEWAKAYEELADKVAASGKATPETRLKKLAELKAANQAVIARLDPEMQLVHTKAMVARRNQLEAAAK
jgi:hypothetical protein